MMADASPKRRPPAKRTKPVRRKTGTKRRNSGAGSGGTSPWEWAVAAVGFVILAGIVGYLVYEGFSDTPSAHPDIVVVGEGPVRLASGTYLVPITVENRGDVTGAAVQVIGTLIDDAGVLFEESRTIFDFVPQHSKDAGGLYFAADPAAGRLELRVEGYIEP
mgnify:CR=1 FL=1